MEKKTAEKGSDKQSLPQRIRNLFSFKGGVEHITDKPFSLKHSYYKRCKKGNYRYFVWVIVTTDERIAHVRMPAQFKPPKGALVVSKYPKGHRPKGLV